MSLLVVPIVCIGLAVYGWVTLFSHCLHEHERSITHRQRFILFVVLMVGVVLSIIGVGRAANPFLHIK